MHLPLFMAIFRECTISDKSNIDLLHILTVLQSKMRNLLNVKFILFGLSFAE